MKRLEKLIRFLLAKGDYLAQKIRRWTAYFILYAGPGSALVILGFPMATVSGLSVVEVTKITLGLIGQNMSFTWVSRARQSNSLWLHGMFALGSNGFFIFVITSVVAHYTNVPLKLWYTLCTSVGSVHAHYIALHKIEQMAAFRKDGLISRAEHDKSLAQLRLEIEERYVTKTAEALRA